jgi:hypothetical protein
LLDVLGGAGRAVEALHLLLLTAELTDTQIELAQLLLQARDLLVKSWGLDRDRPARTRAVKSILDEI